MDKKIGAQLYTLRSLLQTPEDVYSTFKKVKEIGYKTVQVSGIPMEISPQDIKAAADENDLELICTHYPADRFLADLDEAINYHKILGVNYAGIGSMPGFKADFDGLGKFLSDFNKVAEELKKEGIAFTYHNHAFEFNKKDGKFFLDYIVENTDDNFKIMADTYWIAIGGVDPAKYLKKLGSRVETVHFKDLGMDGNNATMYEVGEGNLCWDEIISVCEEIGTKYAFVEQDACLGGDPLKSMEISYNYLTKKGFC